MDNERHIRINKIGRYMKKRFSTRVIKLSIDSGFTCPNRDGTKGIGGCTFCSSTGSGDTASNIPDQIKLLSNKWPKAKYLAYFQNHTNTYAPVDVLEEKYRKALSYHDVIGLAIATRPDSLPDEVLSLLATINKETFMWVELGLQTSNDKTAESFNRGYPLEVYDQAVEKLAARGIPVVTHLILGLPGETKEDMLASVKHICSRPLFGIKLHLLNIVEGSQMASTHRDYSPFSSISEYSELVISALKLIPSRITIHRLTGDAPRNILISPWWSYKKRTILNTIDARMSSRNIYQGQDSYLYTPL